MNREKVKSNIIFILIILFLVITALMIKFEFNPISQLLGKDDNEIVSNDGVVNYNGVYKYRETLDNVYKLFDGCTLNYYDFYFVVLNDNYYRYKSSCIGTFLLDSGKTSELKFSETVEKNKVIKFDKKQYVKTDLVNSVIEGNYFKTKKNKIDSINANNYHILMKQVQLPGKEFSIQGAEIVATNISYYFDFEYLDNNQIEVKISEDEFSYSYLAKDLNELPLFLGVGNNLSVIEPTMINNRYAFNFKSIANDSIVYDLSTKFPINVDGVSLTTNNSIYIKYSSSDNAFIMLIGAGEKICDKNNNSTDVSYYVFHIKYNHLLKTFDNPEFIKKVYKNEGCKYVDDLMEA